MKQVVQAVNRWKMQATPCIWTTKRTLQPLQRTDLDALSMPLLEASPRSKTMGWEAGSPRTTGFIKWSSTVYSSQKCMVLPSFLYKSKRRREPARAAIITGMTLAIPVCNIILCKELSTELWLYFRQLCNSLVLLLLQDR
jgi:hypothetical protein